MKITASEAVVCGRLIEAIRRNAKLNWPEFEGSGLEGTLRHLTPAHSSPAHLPYGANLETAWVRLTAKQGFEAWFRFTELVRAAQEGEVGISGFERP